MYVSVLVFFYHFPYNTDTHQNKCLDRQVHDEMNQQNRNFLLF